MQFILLTFLTISFNFVTIVNDFGESLDLLFTYALMLITNVIVQNEKQNIIKKSLKSTYYNQFSLEDGRG